MATDYDSPGVNLLLAHPKDNFHFGWGVVGKFYFHIASAQANFGGICLHGYGSRCVA